MLKTFRQPKFDICTSLIEKLSKHDTSCDGVSDILSAVKDRRDYLTVIFDDVTGDVLGGVSYYISNKSDSIEVDHLGTVEQGKGYGTLLMEKVFRTAYRLGKSVSLMSNGSADEFYAKIGMVKLGNKVPVIYEASIDDIKRRYCM